MPVEPHQERVVSELLSRRKAQLKAKLDIPADDPLMQRAKAFSLYLAKLANEDHKIRNFRQVYAGQSAGIGIVVAAPIWSKRRISQSI